MVTNVEEYLRVQETTASGEMAQIWSDISRLYNSKKWHEVTMLLEKLVKRPEIQSGRKLIDLYENFIQDIAMRINCLSLMELLTKVVEQYENADEALAFLTNCEPKLKSNDVAVALCMITKGDILISKKHDVRATKEALEAAWNILDGFDGVSPAHGRFYLLQSRLFKATGDTAEYYRSALKYLGCTPLNDVSIAEQRDHAKCLSLAALISDGIYNFGELLAHPILKTLTKTPDEWLIDMLKAFNQGDIDKYQELKKVGFIREGTLVKNEKNLQTKLLLLSLMEMTFKRPATERQLSFADIAKTTRLHEDQVEILVMKAIAKGLVDGTIDEVAKTVHLTRVQPRVLNRQQIGTMISRLDNWKKEISQVETMMETTGEDILLV